MRRSSLLLSLAALVTVGAVAGALYCAWEPGLPVIEPPANALPFPINIRLVLAGWNLIAFDDAPFAPDASKDDPWNRSKYLVEGLAHCSA